MDRAELKARSGRFEQLPWGLELAQLIQVGPESDPQPLHYGKRPPTFTGSGGLIYFAFARWRLLPVGFPPGVRAQGVDNLGTE